MGKVKDKTLGHVPERKQPEKEKTGYPHETEVAQPQEGNDASFSEQTDVSPPTKREFPSVGPAETDFVSRPHGRTTGRMVGHEPGTENNL
ncbi:hypothetical protein SAMN05216490_1727 [Mucilaginibacter mallensis]|uniref:Uncharacterized protein n=1 Tax=Mucilaginibacter mallensis TaxID=652787 RepID=A0A1H1UQH0_MUCMA|nr:MULTISPECIES: hypothetical protein [Mucilaginibacter]MBB6137442.1 hypothetical protein [Mucilaginibacter sp. X5P1]SDS74521.1 hypothetical protein SAMN05216490_1727 [Mucilaginibacter mallensis]